MTTTEHQEEEFITAKKEEQIQKKEPKKTSLWLLILLTTVTLAYLCWLLIAPPKAFLPDTYIEIPKGYTLTETANLLSNHSFIQSKTIFLFMVQRAGKEKGIQSGMYFFKDPVNVFEVARRVMKADYGIRQLKITLPEGVTTEDMSNILGTELPVFDKSTFQLMAKEKEGYLFPDTYFFYATATSGPIITTLEENFDKRTENLKIEAEKLNKNWNDVVIIASLLEEEATTEQDRGLVSGIIWKRLKMDMPLQIDATLGYVTGKGSLQLTATDLRMESPYNTYTHRGLPPTPISNPGLSALRAALYPTTSPYLYYLSDKNGVIHYAKTFEEHKLNKVKYLR